MELLMNPDRLDGKAVVIAGGSGFLGQSLSRYLVAQGARVVVLSRSSTISVPGAAVIQWDARTLGSWTSALDGADALVNLCGRSVDCVKTPDHCDEILRSRVESTRVLGEAIRHASDPPKVWVQMATAHIYGDPPIEWCDESSAFGYGLAPTVGRAWETAFHESKHDAVRGVVLRTSFVIGRGGGALSRLATLARFGLGGRVGHGRQGMSWIHELDMNRVFERALIDATMDGAYIASSPNPLPNAVFMRELRSALRMPIGLPAMAWMVRIGAPLVMRIDPELALYGRYVTPKRLLDEGFSFEFPELSGALHDLTAGSR